MEDNGTALTTTNRVLFIPLNSSHHVTTLSTRYKERVAHMANESPSFTSSGYMLWKAHSQTLSEQEEHCLQFLVLT